MIQLVFLHSSLGKKYGGNKESSNKSTEPVSANVTHKDMGQMTRSRRRSSHEEYSAHTSARQDETVISDRNDHLDRHVGRSKCAERPTCKEKHSRTKRPDMAIYVPRPKMALLKEQASTPLEEKATSDSESVDRDEEARMPLLLSYDSSFHISNDEFECNADEKTGTVDCKSSLKSGITIPTVVGTKASPLPKMVDNTGLEDIDPSRGFIVWNSRFGDQDSALGRSSSLEIVSNRQTLVTADVKLTGKGRGRLSRIRSSSSKSDTVPGKFEGPPSPSSSLPTIIEKLDINGPLSNYRRTSAVSQLGTSPKGIDEEQKNIGMSIAGSQASIGTETSAECENSISRNTATEEKLPLEFKRTRKILDWSAEVEAAEELEDVDSTSDDAWGHEIQKVDVSVIQETTNDSEKQEQKSEAKSGVRTKSSRRRAGKEKSTAERSGRRRSGRSKLSPEKDTDKTDITRISSSPKTDVTHISTSPKTEAARITSSPKTGGIIHVPVLSELPTPPLLPIATNTGMSPVDLSHDRKQLYDPDHPDRPLCVVPPAHHLSPFNRFLPEFGGSHHPVKPSFYPEVGPSSFPIPPSFSPSLPMPPHPGFVPGYHYPPMMPPPRGYFPSGQHPHHTIPVEGPYIK